MKIKYILLLLPFLMLSCANGKIYKEISVKPTNMSIVNSGRFLHAVEVKTVSISPKWQSDFNNYDFKKALKKSLRAYNLFNHRGAYSLYADLISTGEPLVGSNYEVETTILYTLKDNDSNHIIMQEKIVSSGTSKIYDAVEDYERLLIASEESIKNNIRTMIKMLMAKS